MAKILLEDTCGEFIIDRSAAVAESTVPGRKGKCYPGRFSVCDTLNGNRRKYPRRVWEKNLAEGSALQEGIKRNSIFGLLEHPEDGKIDLRSPIAVMITKAELKESGEVHGEILVLDTSAGKDLQALIEAGYNPFVSSRGFGSLVKDTEGVDIVQEDFVCEGWDVVLKPSFSNAEIWVHDRSQKKDNEAAFAESKKISKVDESQPSTTGTAAAEASTSKPKTTSIMDIKTIREGVNALRAVNVKALTPQRFAEGLSQIEALNREAAKLGASNAEFAWDAKKLHDDLAEIEKSWTESAQAPTVAAAKLKEDNTKLLKVTATVAKTAKTYHSKLGESLKKIEESKKLVEEVTKRGRGWKARAEMLEAKLAETTEAFETAAESLDALGEMYNKHVTQLGAKVLTLEFKDKLGDPAIQKALKEAKHPNHIKKIRETLSPKEKSTNAPAAESVEAPAAPAPEADKKDETPSAETPATESNKSPAAPAAGETPPVKEGMEAVVESKKDEQPAPISSMMESVAIARRLSTATAK